ncbi:hypothetical protein GCM10025768_08380 [Microbacterium pseudoresistens]|uniref:Undecaprenyl-diphosphatase n=1 Tax=Microbacterium pseudoresistens TaxID=640634 RepID=A0A7Y9EVG0_9MICO|nr:phosphatase PAP2 family protein [Microbacterium pseudoresistens]NYD54675.1 undecaprenyl-diphosphatase [Microbacterium pseudoresistens]
MTRRRTLFAGLLSLVVFAVLAIVVGVAPGAVDPLDHAWNGMMASIRSEFAVQAALVMNALGGGWIATFAIPLLLAAVAALVRGWRVGVVALLAFIASALAVQVLKHLLGRERPIDLLVASDFGSFPSGHTANAATIGVVLCLILPRVLGVAVALAWTVLMALSRTVLSVHWLSDTVGGALLGAGVGLIVVALCLGWVRPRVEGSEREGAEREESERDA